MTTQSINGLPIVPEQEAAGEVAELYDEIQREMQLPFVINLMKGLAAAPDVLRFHLALTKAFDQYMSLPQSLISMIRYTIAVKSDCTYCTLGQHVSCRVLGVDEATMGKLAKDLDNLNPERVRAIIKFAVKIAKYGQNLRKEDYDQLRDLGVTEAEIVEIIMISAIAVYSDVLADGLQVAVDDEFVAALAEFD